MQNSVASGKYTARRTVLAQCMAAGTAALLGLLHGPESALAALAGGLIVASGTALFAWRMFLKGIAPGELVAADGAGFLTDGAAVTLSQPAAAGGPPAKARSKAK